MLLDSIDLLTGAKTDFADLPAGTRAISLPDNSYNRAAPFLKVFGRPEGASVCECERVQSSSLAQSLHLMNSAEVKSKLTVAGGRADRLGKPEVPVADGIREIYLAAFNREPSGEEISIAEDHLVRERTDAAGKPIAAAVAKRQAYEDLLWAILSTKEFLYNH